ncbi:RNA methyltransferase [Brachybacterium sp. JHP9]|uniref:RNA methyltransferase n=1 Tax=Brachybacterium equifaecis TaxID=2910770 RepID=A0ABT0QZK0_9MICO|nr:RNA methyltransferase [Brachybacterium equifaecis]MCL6422658.1 RNA methyltransferase [Brachybacterium equifaecis]
MSNAERPDGWAITSPRSDRVRMIASLSGRSARRKLGMFRAEGPQAVRSLLEHRAADVRELYLTDAGTAANPDLLALAAAAGRRIRRIPEDVLRAMVRSGNDAPAGATGSGADGPVSPQGVLALAAMPEPGLDDVLEGLPHGPLTLLVLHEVQDPGNVGTLIRAADASGAAAVIATAGTADVWAPKTVRSAAGSLFHLPVVTGIDPERLLPALAEHSISALATSGYAAQDLYDAELPERSAWLLGNEGHGLPDAVLQAADLAVRIPLAGSAESLNVAIAATVCLFETMRRRGGGAAR